MHYDKHLSCSLKAIFRKHIYIQAEILYNLKHIAIEKIN